MATSSLDPPDKFEPFYTITCLNIGHISREEEFLLFKTCLGVCYTR